MREYRRRRVTLYSATIPMRPDKRLRACYRYGGVGPSPALALLPDTHGIASSRRLGSVGAPAAGGSGARNATRQGSSATS
jgi:hypothetical protein